ncbi:hypothetical protein RHSP_26082 [Rhizobium freirei PRF 81]|uniref:Uncharacterized protein n=1 Tax=Rhizobium freirei PRF 81 TaxID=363754 RepID=N6V087_9HYPH|nr:hypothetical protein RHSP_26082 [Rhizobium freirei PRF 81]
MGRPAARLHRRRIGRSECGAFRGTSGDLRRMCKGDGECHDGQATFRTRRCQMASAGYRPCPRSGRTYAGTGHDEARDGRDPNGKPMAARLALGSRMELRAVARRSGRKPHAGAEPAAAEPDDRRSASCEPCTLDARRSSDRCADLRPAHRQTVVQRQDRFLTARGRSGGSRLSPRRRQGGLPRWPGGGGADLSPARPCHQSLHLAGHCGNPQQCRERWLQFRRMACGRAGLLGRLRCRRTRSRRLPRRFHARNNAITQKAGRIAAAGLLMDLDGSGRELGQNFFRNFEVRVDILNVVVVFEAVDELQQRLGLFFVDRHIVLRAPDRLDRFGFAERRFERLGNFTERFEGADDPMTFLVAFDIVSASFDRRFHHLVGIANGRLVGDFADVVEGEGHRTGFAKRAAGLCKDRADVGSRAVAVVGQRFDDDRRAARAVAFVTDRIVILGVGTGRLLDSAIDIVLRHRLRLGVLNRQAQARVHGRVRQARLGGDGDFTRQLREHFGTHRVLTTLAVHDVFKL